MTLEAVGLFALTPRGITVWAPCVVASFESSSDTSSTAACAGIGPPYSGSGRWVCFTGQPRTAQEYKGQGSKVPSYLGLDRRMASLLSSKDGPRRIG